MGLFDRILRGANRVGGEAISVDFRDRRWDSGSDLVRAGQPADGRIVGIERKLEDGTDTELFALEITGDGERDAAGTRIRTARMQRLRIGMPVLLRVDGKGHAVLDWPAMCDRWQVSAQDAAQRVLRSAPGTGVKDTALDMRVQRHLKKWAPARATIVAIKRRAALGMPTQNWDVDLTSADGSAITAANEVIPFYAHWLAVPGAEVPVVIDPKKPANASVDWPEAANEAAERPGALDDAPPAGSAAEVVEAADKPG